MKQSRLHIAIIVQSQIIYTGLHAVISQSELDSKIIKLEALDDLNHILHTQSIDVLIVNPILVANRDKDIKKIRKIHPNLSIVGINIGLIDSSFTKILDDSFSLLDPVDQIISKLQKVTYDTENKVHANTENLTDREIDVLTHLANGLSNKEIAEELNISIHTVITHRKNIATKTGIRSQSGLTIYAISKKIIDIDDGLEQLRN